VILACRMTGNTGTTRESPKTTRRGPSKVNCPSTLTRSYVRLPLPLCTVRATVGLALVVLPPLPSRHAIGLFVVYCEVAALDVQHTVVSTDKPLYVVFIGLTHAYYPARFIQTSELRSHSFPSQGGGHPNNDAGSGGLADKLGRKCLRGGVNILPSLSGRPGSCPVAVDWARCIVVPSAHPSCAGERNGHKESHC